MRIYITILIALVYCSCRRSIDNSFKVETMKWDKNKKLEFLTYGMPGDATLGNAADVVSDKWGFRTKGVGNCLVTQRFVDSVGSHNDMVNRALVNKFGKNWRNKYSKEVDAELAYEKEAIKLLDKQSGNVIKRKELEKKGDGLHYYLWPAKDAKTYEVLATGWGEIDGKNEYVMYYKYIVNLEKSSVKLVSDKVVKY